MTTPLNPGIQKIVALLNAAGYVTTDSGDGETHDFECDRGHGYVIVAVAPIALITAADGIKALLQQHGIEAMPLPLDAETKPGPHIEASYDPSDGLAFINIAHVHDRMLGEVA